MVKEMARTDQQAVLAAVEEHFRWWLGVIARNGEGLTEDDLDLHFAGAMRSPEGRLGILEKAMAAAKTTPLRNITEVLLEFEPDGRLAQPFEVNEEEFDVLIEFEPSSPHRITFFNARVKGGASTTAIMAAANRAYEWRKWGEEAVFADSLAEALGGSLVTKLVEGWLADPSMEARGRLPTPRYRVTEDTVEAAVKEGVNQYVILGAGLDSFAYRRRDLLEHLKVFEVDQPSSQRWKRRRLELAGIAEPEKLVFVAVDFETEDLQERLLASGFDPAQKAAVSWLGVTYYLTPEAMRRTLEVISSWAPGTKLVFDYFLPEETWDERVRLGMKMWTGTGEAYHGLYYPDEMEQMLMGLGFGDLEQLSRRGAYQRYLPGDEPPDGADMSRTVTATVLSR